MKKRAGSEPARQSSLNPDEKGELFFRKQRFRRERKTHGQPRCPLKCKMEKLN